MRTEPYSRRTVFTSAVALVAAAFAPSRSLAQTQGKPSTFKPAAHPQDGWFDSVPGKHRSYLDASTTRGAAEALLYANNLLDANKQGYALKDADVAIVIGLRHFATAFAFSDTVWAKHGKAMSAMLEFVDPKTKQPPTTNLMNSADFGMMLPNFGNTIPALAARGVRFAVCDMATHFLAQQLATGGGSADAIYADLTSSLIPSSRLVPAGVVAVNRAQEHGYTLLATL